MKIFEAQTTSKNRTKMWNIGTKKKLLFKEKLEEKHLYLCNIKQVGKVSKTW